MEKKKCNCGRDMYAPEMATVLRSEPMTEMERFFEFKLDSGKPLGHMPGQFAEISVPGVGEAPISVSSPPSANGSFEMVVRRVGNVTGAMHALSAGDKVGVRGPYGTSFPVEGAMKGKDLVFICGGIGLVPVRSAIQYVLGNRKNYGAVTILFGAKTPAERLFVAEVAGWAARKDVTFLETVDRPDAAWKGNVGVITTLMHKLKLDPPKTCVIVCGPPIMYKFVAIELQSLGMTKDKVYLSLERLMKCGVGKCGHCQINGFYACQDGPVFNYADLGEVREAIQ